MSPARFRWGVILVQLGILLLLRNMAYINDNVWEDLLFYAPILLIIIGIEKIFTKSRLQVIAYLSSVILFLGGFYIAFEGSWGDDNYSYYSESGFEEEFDPSIKKISAVVDLGRTNLTIRDSGSDLIYGSFDRLTRKPKIETSITDALYNVELTQRSRSWFGGGINIDIDGPNEWYLKFSDKIPIDLECYGLENDIHLNLSTTPIEKLKLRADESSIYIKVGDLVSRVSLSIDGDASDLRLRIPRFTGVKIIGEDYGPYLKKIGFSEMDGGYINEGFDTLNPQFEIELDDRFSSMAVDFF